MTDVDLDRLKGSRLAARLTLLTMGTMLGVAPGSIYNYEDGVTPISATRLALWAVAAGRSVGYYYGETSLYSVTSTWGGTMNLAIVMEGPPALQAGDMWEWEPGRLERVDIVIPVQGWHHVVVTVPQSRDIPTERF